jgi:hypothetical protein
MSVGPTDRSAGLLVGRTHSPGTAVSLVGGDPGVPMSHTHELSSYLLSQAFLFYSFPSCNIHICGRLYMELFRKV